MTNNQREIYVQPGQGESYGVLGDVYTVKVKSEDTGGAYGFLEVILQPQGGAPAHTHSKENESFYILEGELEFQIEEQTIVGTPGSFIHIPIGKLHSFTNKTETPVKVLILLTPGGLEEFFAEFGTKVESPLSRPAKNPADLQRLPGIAAKFGTEMKG